MPKPYKNNGLGTSEQPKPYKNNGLGTSEGSIY